MNMEGGQTAQRWVAKLCAIKLRRELVCLPSKLVFHSSKYLIIKFMCNRLIPHVAWEGRGMRSNEMWELCCLHRFVCCSIWPFFVTLAPFWCTRTWKISSTKWNSAHCAMKICISTSLTGFTTGSISGNGWFDFRFYKNDIFRLVPEGTWSSLSPASTLALVFLDILLRTNVAYRQPLPPVTFSTQDIAEYIVRVQPISVQPTYVDVDVDVDVEDSEGWNADCILVLCENHTWSVVADIT